MQRTTESRNYQQGGRPPLLSPFNVLIMAILLLLLGYALFWMSRGDPHAAREDNPVAVPIKPTPSLDEWSAKSVRAIGLAHVGAALAKVSLPAERLAEYHTLDEVFGRTPNPVVPIARRLETFQRGTYPGLSSKLENVMGEPLNSPLRAYAEMTSAEKLLFYSDWAGTPTRDLPVYYEMINRMNSADLPEISGYGMLDAVWNESDVVALAAIYRRTGREKAKLIDALSEEWLPMFLNPISLRLFEPWHKEWAAGQGYIFEITEPKERIKLVDAVIEIQIGQGTPHLQPRSNEMPWSRPAPQPAEIADTMDYYKFFYYRVYGENPGTVLAEGVLQVESYQAKLGRWESKAVKQE